MVSNSTSTSTSTDGFVDLKHQLKTTQLVQSHEQTILQVKNQQDLDLLDKKHNHQLNCIKKELGVMGRIFGGKELTALNISGLLIFLLLIIGLILSFIVYESTVGMDNVLKVWSIITPIITLTLGYIFGNKTSKKTRTK